MTKKQRDRKNRKRAIKVGELSLKNRTVRYVEVQFLMKVGGKVFGGKRFHYRRADPRRPAIWSSWRKS